MSVAKICVLGSKGVGKSAVSDFLSQNASLTVAQMKAKAEAEAERPAPEYMPTHGVRICEFERNVMSTGANLQVQLWDVSGDLGSETLWPAMALGCHGVILVYNPEQKGGGAEAERWADQFARQLVPNMDDSRITVVALKSSDGPPPSRYEPLPGPVFQRVRQCTAAIGKGAAFDYKKVLFQELDKLLANVSAWLRDMEAAEAQQMGLTEGEEM